MDCAALQAKRAALSAQIKHQRDAERYYAKKAGVPVPPFPKTNTKKAVKSAAPAPKAAAPPAPAPKAAAAPARRTIVPTLISRTIVPTKVAEAPKKTVEYVNPDDRDIGKVGATEGQTRFANSVNTMKDRYTAQVDGLPKGWHPKKDLLPNHGRWSKEDHARYDLWEESATDKEIEAYENWLDKQEQAHEKKKSKKK